MLQIKRWAICLINIIIHGVKIRLLLTSAAKEANHNMIIIQMSPVLIQKKVKDLSKLTARIRMNPNKNQDSQAILWDKHINLKSLRI